jgi:hypothetical protein
MDKNLDSTRINSLIGKAASKDMDFSYQELNSFAITKRKGGMITTEEMVETGDIPEELHITDKNYIFSNLKIKNFLILLIK